MGYGSQRRQRHSGESTDSYDDANNDTAEMSDWYLPIALMDKRHIEKILGTNKSSGTWRMKERVRSPLTCIIQYSLLTVGLA